MSKNSTESFALYTDFFTEGPLPAFDPKDLPVFKPNKSRKQNIRKPFNCYAFAVNKTKSGVIHPGASYEGKDNSHLERTILRTDWASITQRAEPGSDGQLPDMEEIVQSALAGALNDGCLRLRKGDNVPAGYYPAALVGFEQVIIPGEIAPRIADFHFLAMYRDIGDDWSKDRGYIGWAQKIGKKDVTRRDAENQLILDPREARFEYPGRFYTFLAVPKGGIVPSP